MRPPRERCSALPATSWRQARASAALVDGKDGEDQAGQLGASIYAFVVITSLAMRGGVGG